MNEPDPHSPKDPIRPLPVNAERERQMKCSAGEYLLYGKPVDEGSWLPGVLDPTPGEIWAFAQRCLRLAEAIRASNAQLAGLRCEKVFWNAPENAAIAFELFEAIADLGAWTAGDESVFYMSGNRDLDNVGWRSDDTFLQVAFWDVSSLLSEIASQLNALRLACFPQCADGGFTIVDENNSENRFVWFKRQEWEHAADEMAQELSDGKLHASSLTIGTANAISRQWKSLPFDENAVVKDWTTHRIINAHAMAIAQARIADAQKGKQPLLTNWEFETDDPSIQEDGSGTWHQTRVVSGTLEFPCIVPGNAWEPELDYSQPHLSSENTTTNIAEQVLTQTARLANLTLSTFGKRQVNDAVGSRVLSLDMYRHPGFSGFSRARGVFDWYPEELFDSDPFVATLELEALTNTRLHDGGDPIWFLKTYAEFTHLAEKFGTATIFCDYCETRYGDRVDKTGPQSTSPLESETVEEVDVSKIEADTKVVKLSYRQIDRLYGLNDGNARKWKQNGIIHPLEERGPRGGLRFDAEQLIRDVRNHTNREPILSVREV